MNKNDLRFVRTEENLETALLLLLEKRPIEDISISGLCREASCSRNAFYQHYETKYELYERILNETVETIQDSCLAVIADLSEVNDRILEQYIHRLLEAMYSRRREITAFLKSSHTFRDTLSVSMYTKMIEQDLKVTGRRSIGMEAELLTLYVVSGITGFIEHWLLRTDLTLSEAQYMLDQCTRDILRRTVDSLRKDD